MTGMGGVGGVGGDQSVRETLLWKSKKCIKNKDSKAVASFAEQACMKRQFIKCVIQTGITIVYVLLVLYKLK